MEKLRRVLIGLAIISLAVLALVLLTNVRANAAPPPTLFGDVGVCDPWYPTNCLAPSAGGSLPVGAKTTTASPTYVDGTVNPLSNDVHGGGRVLVQDSLGTPVDWTLPVQVTLLPSATVGLSTQSCSVACASTLLSGTHGVYGITGSATVVGWILVYDAVSCSANGTVTPKKAFAYTVANSTIGISWADSPMINATGVAVCFSTTGPYTATASTTAYLSVDFK